MEDILRKLFKPTRTYQLGSYRGKHLLEKEIKSYISEDEFIQIMEANGYDCKDNHFKVKEKKLFNRVKIRPIMTEF